MTATGRCLCGAVKFSAEGVESDVHACQCTMGRRWAGGPVLVNDHYIMSMGNFDDQSSFRLAAEIFVDAPPPVFSFSGDHPRMTADEFMASLAPPGP
jgi:hypothetical protein